MSAFTVSQEHVAAMLQASTGSYPGDGRSYRWNGENKPFNGSFGYIGQTLINENYRSVNFRYSESEPAPPFVPHMVRDISPVEMIKLIHCYRYQSCETPDWTESEAYAIVDALESMAMRKLPGYDEAEWTL